MREGGPAALEADLEHGAQDAAGRLGDVDHVGDEGEPVELELRDVGLEEDVDLGRRVVDRLLDGDRHALEELGELEPARQEGVCVSKRSSGFEGERGGGARETATHFSSGRTGTFLNSSESEKMRKSSMKPPAALRCWL